MIWDRVAPLYDFFENTFNRAVYDGTGEAVARMIRPDDRVLECACGTGAISVAIAPVCARLVATDYSEGMLSQARKKLATPSSKPTSRPYATSPIPSMWPSRAMSSTCCLTPRTPYENLLES